MINTDKHKYIVCQNVKRTSKNVKPDD
jgi:hypothetical protein